MFAAAITISCVIMVAAISYNGKAKVGGANAEEKLSSVPDQITETTTIDSNICGYVLKEYKGTLALFREGSEEPYRVLNVDLSTLSDYDKKLLEKGIVRKTEHEFNTLIEDYTS
jgi:hypothetical protein